MTEPLPKNKLHTPGAVVCRVRELDQLPAGTIAQATSSPSPRYFLRSGDGWLACTRDGSVALHMELWTQLDGWPHILPSRDLRRPVTVVSVPAPTPERIPA